MPSATDNDAATLAANLRRMMARDGLTFDEVVEATGLDERTIRALTRAVSRPHARTVHKLAAGLGVAVNDFYRPVDLRLSNRFDRATNSLVESIVTAHRHLFQNWTEQEFDELYSRFGTGGELTESGVVTEAQAMNFKRDIWRQVGVILESSQADLLTEMVDVLYRRAVGASDAEIATVR